MKKALAVGAVAVVACAGNAQVVDGINFDSEYGAALWSQNIGTQFGNSTDPDSLHSNGSEIDALFGTVSGGTLYLGFGGNLETNFNKLNVVLDFKGGGLNTLSGYENLGNLDGLTLDAGFDADAVLSYTNGNDGFTGSGNFEHYLDGSQGVGSGGFLGGGERGVIGAISASLDGASVVFDSNHLNTLGVNSLGNPDDSDPATVFTGVEMSIDLAALGWDGLTPIKIAGWVNGSGNDFLSNQVVGGLPDGTGNLGAPGGVNFAGIAGDQFVVIPAPGSLALLGLTGLGVRRRR